MLQVPHVVYEERIIEVPQAWQPRAFSLFHPGLADSGAEVERRELIRHVPVSNAGTLEPGRSCHCRRHAVA